MSTSRVDGGNFESGMHTAGGVEEKDSYGGGPASTSCMHTVSKFLTCSI